MAENFKSRLSIRRSVVRVRFNVVACFFTEHYELLSIDVWQLQRFLGFTEFVDLLVVSFLELNLSPKISQHMSWWCGIMKRDHDVLKSNDVEILCEHQSDCTGPSLLNGRQLCSEGFHSHLSTTSAGLPPLLSKFPLSLCYPLLKAFFGGEGVK